MRRAIRELLIASIPEIQGRVYEPHAAGVNTQKPYIVLREGIQNPEDEWSKFSTIIEVWPYVKRTTFQEVDALCNAIINALHRARFSQDGEQFLADYIGTVGPDFVDEDWDAITRGLKFRVFSLGWFNGLTFEPDPVATLQAWTKNTFPEVHVDPATWAPADATPGIYWRLSKVNLESITQAISWFEAQIAGHIIAPSTQVRLIWLRKIVEALANQRKLIMSDGGLIEFLKIRADSEADPMRKGQIELIARFGVLRTKETSSILNKATIVKVEVK
ncbi:conserved hypothetical protein [Caldicellulosiruptor hydrothermalis 108]|uniref:Uncharacterized protein n=1 Tax=Caldicellulosiruptor hydrothermalis (strain DSM 18901 / VKM B-2411 / 108) TaxID=632292 RepID=E4QE13_CALH1|nr:hypothetical protein [Caldicellulosiruptor hydrothermalis]ADQ06507.1 conserved hypothetical protein [Caldicellulosiruptor hydrothermalis 108]